MKIYLPGTENPNRIEMELEHPLIIVGANGSGKSHLGQFIENNFPDAKAKRISAQRILEIPERAAVQTYEQASTELYRESRGSPVHAFQNEYGRALSVLFSEKAKRNEEYVESQRSSEVRLPIPDSAIEKTLRIWDNIFPHRKIVLESNKVHIHTSSGYTHGQQLSDGERVCLYLLAQCMCIPDQSLIIIDEPELHMHKSLMNAFWNAIESERKTVGFVYITHDLDFAARSKSRDIIWVKSFDYNAEFKWKWEKVPVVEGLPDDLVLEIIGSRKNTLFIEGTSSSIDYEIYSIIYSDFHLVPVGNCTKVIEATKAFRACANLHNRQANGLIDLDEKEDDELAALMPYGIQAIPYGEVENIFLDEVLVREVSMRNFRNPDEDFASVKNKLLSMVSANREAIISGKTSSHIEYRLGFFNRSTNGIDDISENVRRVFENINVSGIWEAKRSMIDQAISTSDYQSILKHYTNKGMSLIPASIFGMKPEAYRRFCLGLLRSRSEGANALINLRQKLPSFGSAT